MRSFCLTLCPYIIAIAGLLLAGFLLSAPTGDCPPLPVAGPTSKLVDSIRAMQNLAPGESFEISGTSAEWAGWLAAQIADPAWTPIAGLKLDARPNSLVLDVCLQQIGLLPTRLHAALSIASAGDGCHFACTELTLGRMPLPSPARALVARQLDGVVSQVSQRWLVDRVDLGQHRITIAGRSR